MLSAGKGSWKLLSTNQFQELLESDQAKIIFDNAEVRGFIDPAELEAFALEHDMSAEEIEELTREIERLGHDIAAALPCRCWPPQAAHRSRGGPSGEGD